MKKFIFAYTLFLFVFTAKSQGAKEYREDFDYFWNTINEYYSYWDKKQTDWNKVKEIYGPVADTISTKRNFILLLEKAFYELYDHHASLNSNTMESQRLVPSGADLWAEYKNGIAVITEVRQDFGASRAGMKAGMEIISFNDMPVEKAIEAFLPISLKKADIEARNFALRVLLAGKHSEIRKITVRYQNKIHTFFPDHPVNLLREHQYPSDIESKKFNGNIGYIKINNRLWDNNLIPLFDSVLNSLSGTKAMILDLRETPGGGNTTVARSIIGRFISKEGFYQKHELTAEEKSYGVKRSWVEMVSPRKTLYSAPLVILVNHWTGSVGEGITIGFDALKRATIIGTRMAGLNGANYSFTMPHSKIGFSFPAEKLFHVNGSPREIFIPRITVDMKLTRDHDLILEHALKYLQKK